MRACSSGPTLLLIPWHFAYALSRRQAHVPDSVSALMQRTLITTRRLCLHWLSRIGELYTTSLPSKSEFLTAVHGLNAIGSFAAGRLGEIACAARRQPRP